MTQFYWIPKKLDSQLLGCQNYLVFFNSISSLPISSLLYSQRFLKQTNKLSHDMLEANLQRKIDWNILINSFRLTSSVSVIRRCSFDEVRVLVSQIKATLYSIIYILFRGYFKSQHAVIFFQPYWVQQASEGETIQHCIT